MFLTTTILLGILLVLGFVWRSIQTNRYRQLSEESESEMKTICDLPIEEARRKALAIISKAPEKLPWQEAEIEIFQDCLHRLDPETSKLFEKFRRINFGEFGLELDATWPQQPGFFEAFHAIGRHRGDGYDLAVREKSPEVYEFWNGQLRDKHKSIYHLILLVHEDDFEEE